MTGLSVRLYGHAHMSTGYGRASLELVMALDRAGVRLEVRTIGRASPEDEDNIPNDLLMPIEAPDAIIVHTLPGDCHRVLELEGLKRGAGPKLVAYTTWEALSAPSEVSARLRDHFDQVWVPSTPAAGAIGGGGTGWDFPSWVRVLPHCFDERRLTTSAPARSASAGPFRFYWIGAWTARKNPAGLIRAFANAFSSKANVELVVHSPGVSIDVYCGALASTGLAQHELPAITLSNRRLDARGMAELHAGADCFATAARGEAWNLPAFDALLAGRHIISQYGMGSDEFLEGTSADLIDGWESPAQVDVELRHSSDGEVTMKTIGAQGLTSRSLWLEPNLSTLADAMTAAYESKKRTIAIDYDIAGRFGYAAVAKMALNMLEEV